MPLHGGDQLIDFADQLGGRQFDDVLSRTDEEPARWQRVRPLCRQSRAKTPTDAIAHHGRADGAADGERHAWWRSRRIVEKGAPEHSGPGPATLVRQTREDVPFPDAPDQADSLWRPFNRRARITARPPRVDMRFRKPCFLARFRTLGWNVRFNGGPPRTRRTGVRGGAAGDRRPRRPKVPVLTGTGPARPTSGGAGNCCAPRQIDRPGGAGRRA